MFKKGHIPWNKGRTGVYSDEPRRLMGLANRGKHRSPTTEFKKGLIPWNKGTKGLVKPNRGSFNRGQTPWNKGTKGLMKPNKTSFKKGQSFPKEWIEKRALNRQLQPNLEPSEDLAYILGVLKGDGCVSINRSSNAHFILLQATSLEFVQSFAHALKSISLNPHVSKAYFNPKSWAKKTQYLARAISRVFVQWYVALSLENVENFVRGFEIDFIRGFYESEGSVGHSSGDYGEKWKLGICNSNRSLIEMVQTLLWKINFKLYLYGPYKASNPRSRPYYVLNTGDKAEILRFLQIVKPCIKNSVS